MTVEERRTETHEDGSTHTTTVIDRDSEPRRSGGNGILIGAILLIALVVGGYFLLQATQSEQVKDNAVAEAAGSVGDAAGQVGDAAQDAADNLNK